MCVSHADLCPLSLASTAHAKRKHAGEFIFHNGNWKRRLNKANVLLTRIFGNYSARSSGLLKAESEVSAGLRRPE